MLRLLSFLSSWPAVLLLAGGIRMSAAQGGSVMSAATGGLSNACASNAIGSLKSPKIANCVNLLGLFQLATMDSDESVVDPLQDYISGIKDEPPCKQEDLAAVNNTINLNCKAPSDQKAPTLAVIKLLINNYNPLRAMLLASPANATADNDFCLTDMLSAAEKASGKQFTQDYLKQMFSGDISPLIQMLDKNTGIYCNDCGKTVGSLAITIAKNNTNTAGTSSNIQKTLDSKCGTGFTPTNGSIPSDITTNGGNLPTIVSMFTIGFALALSLVWVTAV